MKKFSIHSLIIGIGIGMIITASMNIMIQNQFFIMRNTKADNLISEEIQFSNETVKSKELETEIEDPSFEEKDLTEEEKTENEDLDHENHHAYEYHEILIKPGMSSHDIGKLLEEEGIIEDGKHFSTYAIREGVSQKLLQGLKRIPAGSSMEEILEILTRH